MYQNKGFDPAVIQEYRERMQGRNQSFLLNEKEENNEEFVNFFFIGMYEGKEVIYDAAIYTLRLQHSSEIYELAEHKAAQRFPEYQQIKYEEDENGDLNILGAKEEEIGLYMAEVMVELEEEEAVKVQEHVDVDEHLDFGIGLDIGLNVEKITDKVIEKFVKDYNEDTLKLDQTMYSFQHDDDEFINE
jgi:hypothetical protein